MLMPTLCWSRRAAIPPWRSPSPRSWQAAGGGRKHACSSLPPITSRATKALENPCREAAKAAAAGSIVTFGITPTYPATSYGYIGPGVKLNGGAALAIDAFVEKPNAEKACAYIAERFLWNSGNFLFRADVMLEEIAHFEPDIAAAAKSAVAGIKNDLDFLRLPPEPFAGAPKKSIDYAVMERTARATVIPVDLGWSDSGSWNSVSDVLPHDREGNVGVGPVVFRNSRNSLARSEDNIVTAVVGLDNIVVVATSDAVLVASRAIQRKRSRR